MAPFVAKLKALPPRRE